VSTKTVVVGISTEVVDASVIGTSETGVEPSSLIPIEPPHPTSKPTPKIPALDHRKNFKFIVASSLFSWLRLIGGWENDCQIPSK
jgi:hypothetical protein